MQVFYVNIGGGEPTIRSDFYELVDYAVGNGVGVKFSTNGSTITDQRAPAPRRHGLPRRADLHRRRDRGDQRRGARRKGRFAMARRAMDHLAPPPSGRSRSASSSPATTSPSSTRCRRSPTATARSCG